MPSLPLALYSAAQSRTLDALALSALSLPGGALMERAGASAFALLRRRWPRAQRLVVVCGPGNNGGDGYVLARLAQATGRAVTVMAVQGALARGEAAAAHAAFVAAGGRVEAFAPGPLQQADVIVDALFGTGLERPLAQPWATAVAAIGAAAAPVLALDLPTGLHADSGRVLGCGVRAHVTLTFIGLKLGLFTGAGPAQAGEVVFDDLGVPDSVYAQVTPLAARITAAGLHGWLPRRARDGHKGSYGHVLVVGGDRPMGGAPRLAGVAAYRAGAGLVSLAVHQSHASAFGVYPELITYAVADAGALRPRLTTADVIAVGPGLGQGPWGQALWAQVREVDRALVVDADALNLLAHDPQQRDDWVLTPHPGEAARLLGCDTADVQADRPGAARALVARYGGVCVLKGAGTLVADADGLWVCDGGNPGMATAGMGDVLTGVIAALRAQGLSASQAARLGVWVHAAAGDEAARDGEIGLMASDLFMPVHRLLNRLNDDHAAATTGA